MTRTGKIHQDNLQRLKALRYMDDIFMTVCLADNFEGVELILRIVLQRDDITVKSVRTQETLKNLQGRSATLDVHAVDGKNEEFNVEIQREDAGANPKRARHNSSLLDAHILKPGQRTEKLPDSYVIFITERDVMQGGEPVYPVERYVAVGGNKRLFGDGSHILYVNGTYRGDDDIGKLMHDFSCSDPDEMNYEVLAKRARYFKNDEKGATSMCKIIEDMKKEVAREVKRKTELKSARETAMRMIKRGKMPLDEIADYVPSLSINDLKKMKAKMTQMT